ncbi:hypothetical protein KUTeg_009286 [Tegillarca granosa]|uniref:DZIP3-like HEPN domain-containing protein n=1 Tax=Tegillarca granosa TaxID=220873 RepID=A0ABQ9FC02_TEGGR|nr:hypothetical protein KUTeg_009286 [Tegillarca granosa]
MDAAGENEEQKKIRNAQLIRDLSGRIPQKCEEFKNMLVELEAIGFNKAELLVCKEEGVREVFNVLEQKGLIELGKYDKLRSILCRLDKKAVGMIDDCVKDIKTLDGTPYLDILPGFYHTSKEEENFARFCRAIVDLCSDVLRNILHRECQPSNLYKRLQRDATLTLRHMKSQEIERIKHAEKINSYKMLDISSLYLIIRYIAHQDIRKALETKIRPNMVYTLVNDSRIKLSLDELRKVELAGIKRSYDHLAIDLVHKLYMQLCEIDSVQIIPTRLNGTPDKHSTRLGDDIERIRLLRNQVYSHVPSTKISDTDFEKYRTYLGSIMARMDKRLKSYFKINLDLILTSQMDAKNLTANSTTQKQILYHINMPESKQVLVNYQSLEEIKSNLRHANEKIRILLLAIESIKEKIEMEDKTTDTAIFSEHDIQIKLINKSETESRMKILLLDKEIELEKTKGGSPSIFVIDQIERKDKATERARRTDHEMKLELINKKTIKSEKESRMRLEILDKEIELEKAKSEKYEKEGSARERARQSENENQTLQYKHIVMSERESQMRLEILDKERALEKAKSDRLSHCRSLKEACMYLMVFSVTSS